MKQKGVLVLTLVTLATVAVAAVALHQREEGSALSTRKLFQGLDENEVAEITVEKGGKHATVRREGGEWKLADRGGYPAKFEQVKQTVVRVAGLEIEEEKTARADNHQRLGVKLPEPGKSAESETGQDSPAEEEPVTEAALVTLKDSGGQELAALVVGKTEWRGRSQKVFVRRANEDQVYLCNGRLDVNADPSSWIATDVLKLENDRIQDVVITHADGEEIRIGRSATNHTQFRVENVPPGESERYEGVASGVAQALSALTLEDVRPASEIDFAQEPLAHSRYRCHDGLELLIESAKQDGKTWVKISASYVEPPKPPAAETPATEEPQEPGAEPAAEPEDLGLGGEEEGEATPAEAEEPAGQEAPGEEEEETRDVRKEAEELNAKLAPWAYALPQWKADVIARRMKDLLKEPPADPAAEEAPGEQLEAPAEDSGEAPLESPAPEDDEGASAPEGGGASDEKPPGG